MKIMVLEGVHPPTDGKILARFRPLSMISLQASKSHSSKAPKSELFHLATSSGHGSATQTTLVPTKSTSPHTPKLQTPSTHHASPTSQDDRLSTLIEGLY